MAKVIIDESLKNEIIQKFKAESETIFKFMKTLESNPKKGKELNSLGKLVLKELKYKNFRFYFITEGYKIKFLTVKELNETLIKFLKMSTKNNQQPVINEIKKAINELNKEFK